jgi:hypothetical protein
MQKRKGMKLADHIRVSCRNSALAFPAYRLIEYMGSLGRP